MHQENSFKQGGTCRAPHHDDGPCPLQVPRRVKIEAPSSSCFKVSRQYGPLQQESTKLAPGMEVMYTITFIPNSTDSLELSLVVVTEREKFLVPVHAIGAAPALNLPQQLQFPCTPAKKPAKQVLLVCNAGSKAGRFQLYATGCFSVQPARGYLAPGETMQLSVEFVPEGAGSWTGELSAEYDNGTSTVCQLLGEGQELDVQLSVQQVDFLPTYMSKLSQKAFRIINNSDVPVDFQAKAQPSAQADDLTTTKALGRTAEQRDRSPAISRSTTRASRHGPSASPHQQQQPSQRPWSSRQGGGRAGELQWGPGASSGVRASRDDDTAEQEDDGGDGSSVLEDRELSLTRQLKRTRRDLNSDPQPFSSSYFAMFPPFGTVWPHSEIEVIVQFQPDHADVFQEVAWMEIQGRGERLPLELVGQGLGAQALFTYDSLDVGNAFVNTQHEYQVELMNRGKVEAQYWLQHCHTTFGSKFSFVPDHGTLAPGELQVGVIGVL
jgi:hydrocephalus-inducing protein